MKPTATSSCMLLVVVALAGLAAAPGAEVWPDGGGLLPKCHDASNSRASQLKQYLSLVLACAGQVPYLHRHRFRGEQRSRCTVLWPSLQAGSSTRVCPGTRKL
jgi:hypothetical protein